MRRVAQFSAMVAGVSAVTPTQKVIQMLDEMITKGKADKQDEKVTFATFNQFCRDNQANHANSISTYKSNISRLEGAIAKDDSDAEQAAARYAEEQGVVAEKTGEKEAADAVRAEERKTFIATQTDYEESIDALGRAKQVLKKLTDRAQAPALIQKNKASFLQLEASPLLSVSEKAKVTALLQEPAPTSQRGVNPQADGYESHSDGIIEMFETLESKFVEELRALQREEANTKHAWNLLSQSLHDAVEEATKQSDIASARKAAKEESAAKGRGDKASNENLLATTEKTLKDLQVECEVKTRAYEQKQVLRKEEVEALEKAVEILSGDSVSGAAVKHLPQLIQKTSFLQMRSMTSQSSVSKVIAFLNKSARGTQSRHLALLAAKLGEERFTKDNVFAKVSKMIEDMIQRLMEERNGEEEKFGWCQTELEENKITRTDKKELVDQYTNESNNLQAQIAQQTETLSQLNEAMQENDRAVAEASSARASESAKNKATIKDAKAAQQAVAQAQTVLQEFYGKAAGAQNSGEGENQVNDSLAGGYQGNQDSSVGVLGMIEVIQSDFVRLEDETASEEAVAAKEHQQFLDDSLLQKSVDETEHKHVTKKRARNEKSLAAAQKALAENQEELDAATKYWKKSLSAECENGANMSYEDRKAAADKAYAERKAAREQEIENLKEALVILDQ